jgi:hypothetical protein
MPVIKQKRIYRDDLRANPDVLYLFGDNNDRVGLGGQAAEMRYEPNAVGVRTKWSPGVNPYDFFNDRDFWKTRDMFEQDLQRARDRLQEGGVVVIPLDGLGTGLSELPKRASRINSLLVEMLKGLEELG